MNLREIILMVLCIMILLPLRAQDYYFRHYDNKNGLSHNTVYCSFQDSKGYLWFGTEDGLNRFDGYQFKVFRYHSNQPGSLPNNNIHYLYEDSKGRLWVTTATYTCWYDDKTDNFIPLLLENDRPEHFSYICEDSSGYLWFVRHDLIVKQSLETGSLQYLPGNDYVYIWNMAMSAKGYPFFSNAHHLHFYRPESGKFESIKLFEEADGVSISAICEVPGLGVLVGTNQDGVKMYVFHNNSIEDIFPETQVRVITPLNAHTYWIGTESGIFIYHVLNRSITHLTKSLFNEYALADNAVYSITCDKEQGMWVGTFFGGISYLPKNHTPFKRFIGGRTHTGLLGNAIREICQDQYGDLWIGTEDNGINHYDKKNGIFTNYSLRNPDNPLLATNIHGLMAEGDKVWIGTYNKGIEVLDIGNGKIVRRYNQQNTGNTLGSDFILCFLRKSDNTLLVGTSSGVVELDEKTGKFRRWNNIWALVRQIYEDKNGNIWVSTANGIHKINPNKGRNFYYTSDSLNPESLPSNNTTSVFEDSQGKIWITTINGFCLYDEQSESFNRVTVEDGLPSNIIYRIQEDDDHYFWVSTANGLVQFDPVTRGMRTFSHREGLHESQFNYSSSYKTPEGMIYMGTINGMIAFNPRDFSEDTYVPPLYISQVKLPGDQEENPYLSEFKKTGILSLPHDKSTFNVIYSAVSFTAPNAIRYAYKLEGIDADWVDMNLNREVTFANLSPGKYTFRVRSTNSSGNWQPNETSFLIVIVPPFWATGWAYTLYGIIIIFMIVILYQYKKKKLVQKHITNQQLFEQQKEKELYDAKIQFFTFITHEIRTPLTLIKAPLEKILRTGDGTTSTKENLRVIEKNTQRLLDLSNQLLDFRRTESKGFKLNFVKTDIQLWFGAMLQRFLPSLQQAGKEIKISIPEGSFHVDIDRDAFVKITGNLITNALKYSDNKIFITLILPREEEQHFKVSIINDGSLIPVSEKDKIFTPFYRLKETENTQGSGIGLSLANTLAEFHNGFLRYQHTLDHMNEFILTLPVKQEKIYSFESVSITDNNHIKENQPVSGKPIILIVEDQSDMREFIAKELAGTYTIYEAGHGKEALEILTKNNVKLIISDIMMPVMDGFELCNTLKNDIHFSHIPLILLTAQHNLQSRLKGLNNGADAYMEKPFSMELLSTQINNLLRNREILNRTYVDKPSTPPETLAVSKIDELFIEKLNRFIDVNMSEDSLTVELIATEMNMSTSSLYRKVKGLSGLTPVDYIRIARLKKAVQYMKEGELRINEIAFKVGFSSPAYFSTCFQKQYGKTPSDFLRYPD